MIYECEIEILGVLFVERVLRKFPKHCVRSCLTETQRKYCVCDVYPTNSKSKKMNCWKRQRNLKMKAVHYSNEAVK